MHLSHVVKKTCILSLLPAALSVCALSACQAATTSEATPATPVAAAAAAQDPGKVLAKVNDATITRSELDRAERILLANNPGMRIPPMFHNEFETQTLNQLIGNELLYQASRKLPVPDLEQQVQTTLAKVKEGYPRREDFERRLKDINLDEKGLIESTRRDLAIAYLVKTTITPKVEVTEDDVEKFYKENPDKFKQPEMVRASHILIGVDAKAGPEEKKAAREKAEKLRKELVGGADFAKLAGEVSTCPSGKQGGDLGLFPRGRMDPAFEKAAFDLKPGELSAVVETRFGYHIIRSAEHKAAGDVPLAEAHDKIKEYLRAQKINAAKQALVGEMRKSAKVEVLL